MQLFQMLERTYQEKIKLKELRIQLRTLVKQLGPIEVTNSRSAPSPEEKIFIVLIPKGKINYTNVCIFFSINVW